MNRQELIEKAGQYLIDNNILKPHGQCERVSRGLSAHLTEAGIENSVSVAMIDTKHYDGNLPFDDIEHYFIKIGRKILDATASQFKGMPRIYYGSLPIYYKLT